jgi:hypothetical protein
MDSEGTPLSLGYGYDSEYGMGGDPSLLGLARYVAVAPRVTSTSLRYLDFQP